MIQSIINNNYNNDIDEFAESAINLCLLILRDRKNIDDIKRLFNSIMHQSVIVHLIETFENLTCNLNDLSNMELIVKLRFIFWISLKTEFLDYERVHKENKETWKNIVQQESYIKEKFLERELFTNNTGIKLQNSINLLSWIIMEILIPCCCYWKNFNLWNFLEIHEESPFIIWASEILNNNNDNIFKEELQISKLKQFVVEIIVLIGADKIFIFKYSEIFLDAYLRTLINIRDEPYYQEVFIELMQSIQKGIIRGDRMYYNDLRILLETLSQFIKIHKNINRLNEVILSIDILLNTACPLGGESETLHGVSEVCKWFELLKLENDYSNILQEGCIDGEILHSHLTLSDIKEMGILDERDANKLLRVLNTKINRISE